MEYYYIYIISFICGIIINVKSHGINRDCFGGEINETAINEVEAFIEKQLNIYKQYDRRRLQESFEPIIIPVVFHVLYTEKWDNVPEDQLQSQIEVLNQDFNALNCDLGQDGRGHEVDEFLKISGNFKIYFYKDQVIRKKTATVDHVYNSNLNDIKFTDQGGSDAIEPTRKLNFWIGPLRNKLLGYAQFPRSGRTITDGVVVNSAAIGSKTYSDNWNILRNYDRGRTGTHEVGHWLGLKHIWADDLDTCGGSDSIGDTPNQAGPSDGCPIYPTESCGSVDMTMNFMDYVYDRCATMFTQGQVERGRALFEVGGARRGMVEQNVDNEITLEYIIETQNIKCPSSSIAAFIVIMTAIGLGSIGACIWCMTNARGRAYSVIESTSE